MNGIVFTLFLFFTAVFASKPRGTPPQSTANNFLVIFTPEQALAMVDCVADGDERVCQEYARCLTLMPKSAERAYTECRQAATGSGRIQCTPQGTTLPPAPVRRQVFRCINNRARQDTPEERMAIVQMELCMQRVYGMRCGGERREEQERRESY